MHACGHDVHIVSLLGAREALAAKREEWSGTFVGVFQPGEEACEGARAMVAAGLVDVMPKPDVFLGQQVMPSHSPRAGGDLAGSHDVISRLH